MLRTQPFTEFYWHINTEEGDEEVEVGYFRKRNQNMALTFPDGMWKRIYK